MPPFPVSNQATAAGPSTSTSNASPTPSRATSSSGTASSSFSQLLRSFGRSALRAHEFVQAPGAVLQTPPSSAASLASDGASVSSAEGVHAQRPPARVFSSSRGAGVRPIKGMSSAASPPSGSAKSRSRHSPSPVDPARIRPTVVGASSRGGLASAPFWTKRDQQQVAKQSTSDSTPKASQNASPALTEVAHSRPSTPSSSHISMPLAAPRPPSQILTSISNLGEAAPHTAPAELAGLLHELSRALELYPFPAPPEAASNLSRILASSSTTPFIERRQLDLAETPLPDPTPLHIYLSQAHLLSPASTSEVRLAVLECMRSCVQASFSSPRGLLEGEKAVVWQEVLRWSSEGQQTHTATDGSTFKALPDADREALVKVLDTLTRGGRHLLDLPGLVTLLCEFVQESFPRPRPSSPIYDSTLATPFTRTIPRQASPHASSLALLTALHKFSFPHISPPSVFQSIRASLDVARLAEETDIGDPGGAGVLGFLDAVVKFGEVKGGSLSKGKANGDRNDQSEEDILREVVSVVARLIGCESLVPVADRVIGADGKAIIDENTMRPSMLPRLSYNLMRDLIRSPANQALKFLHANLTAPSPSSPSAPCPTLELVGSLLALRKALFEHSREVEANAARGNDQIGALQTSETRWPSMLSLGLQFLWSGLCASLEWQSAHVDAEVLALIDERLAASVSEAMHVRQAGNAEGDDAVARRKEASGDIECPVPYEDWDMAVEALAKTYPHITVWEEAARESFSIMGSSTQTFATDEPRADDETQISHPLITEAFASLARRVFTAWRRPGFTGPSDDVFALALRMAPHLSQSFALEALDACERDHLCLPGYPDWIERVQAVLKAFYQSPSISMTSAVVGMSHTIRRRALDFLLKVYEHVRVITPLRDELASRVCLPLLESTFETETDLGIVSTLMDLAGEIARDAVATLEPTAAEAPRSFDRVCNLFARVAKGAVRPHDRYSSHVSTTRAPISRYHKDSAAAGMRSSPSISAPAMGSATTSSGDLETMPTLAAAALIEFFHLCLARSTKSSSEKAIAIFRDLLAILSPPRTGASSPGPSNEPAHISPRARLCVLRWLVRLRADASYRIHWARDVDARAHAEVIGRVDGADGQGEERGRGGADTPRQRDQRAQSRSARELSGSRRRGEGRERSNSQTQTASARGTPTMRTSPTPLWSLPEALPFDVADATSRSVGSDALVSFDYRRMRGWSEDQDPEAGLLKAQEIEAASGSTLTVLPVSEYFGALVRMLKAESDWELVSYILCFLPLQLSNKHLARGPRAALQIHHLRRLLCDGLRQGDKGFLAEVALPQGLKRAEIHAVAYQSVATLVAYAPTFSKAQQDDMVEVLLHGLNNPRDTAKSCIHALAVAAFEMRPSVTKYLAEIVRQLQKIISSATLGVHILELMATVGQEPSLYANFTDVDFQTVFGIALKYIQAHNEREMMAETKSGDELAYAFSQHVLQLAYFLIATWFLAVRLPDRPKHVPFLIRRLIQANEGKPTIDEANEVCFDMIARYTYTNADPRARQSKFDKIIAGDKPTTSSPPTKSWIVGNSLLTVRSLRNPAWVEVTIRRASGIVRMMWELQNVSGVTPESDKDLITMHMRHRELAGLLEPLPSVISEALRSLPDAAAQPVLGHRARSKSFDGTTVERASIERNTFEGTLVSAATKSPRLTLESGPLAVNPAFYPLQLSSFPHVGRPGGDDRPLAVPENPAYLRTITLLDTIPVVDLHKIGVVYVGYGQRTEREILGNVHGSQEYVKFAAALGRLVRLQGCRKLDVYTGGLDSETDFDGKWTYIWDDDISQVVYHVATLMPTSRESDPQMIRKKSHIGNDYVKIIFNDSGHDFAFDTLPGDFNYVNIVIEPQTPTEASWGAPGYRDGEGLFKVSMQRRHGFPEIGPLGAFKMLTAGSLPSFVRHIALQADMFVQIYLSTVGLDVPGASAGTHKLEYSSAWRRRLQEIKALRGRITREQEGLRPVSQAIAPDTSTGAGETSKQQKQPVTMLDPQAEEEARLFTTYFGA